MLTVNEKICGFTLIRKKELSGISAVLYEFEHDGCGARLVHLDRDDSNKTFAIAFPTPPTDNTGVFHIIEHSVLCGSKKYPLKDPFAELLKGSLNTFLNAMTYEDRTVYPVSSRCEKDFLNLVDVYLDAVLSPAMLENPNIFRQEGWHLEYDEESDEISLNGVVYNEMKGAYSSPDEIGALQLSRAMYSGSYLDKDSGGDPSAIPDLTYEKFIETYKKHYNPAIAKIILDGKMDIEKILSLINSHLEGYERCGEPPVAPKIEARKAPTERIRFEIPEGEEERGHGRFLFGYRTSGYEDTETSLAVTILSDLLAGSNASPLKKALLDKGLANDAAMYLNRSVVNTLILEVRDTDEEKFEETVKTIRDTVTSLAKEGIDKKRLTAILDNLDFKQREQDFGTLPVGVAYALSAFGFWMYGASPEDALCVEDALNSMRKKINTDYFERTLLGLMSDNPHTGSIIMIPDKSVTRENARKDRERLSALRSGMTDRDIEKIKKEYSELSEWQEQDDEDVKDTLPKLSISDITDNSEKVETEEHEVYGAKILHHKLKMNGIIYISANFRADDLTKDEILPMSLLSSVLTNLPTESRDVLTLQSDIKSTFGTFFFSGAVLRMGERAGTYMKFFSSLLETKKEAAEDLLRDVMLNTLFDDESEIMNTILQAKSQLEDAMVTSGESVAISRAEAGVGIAGIITEYMSGYEAYKILRDAVSDPEKSKALIEKIKSLYRRLITRERLTFSIAGEYDAQLVSRLVESLPSVKEELVPAEFPPCTDESEFFVIPSKVAYAVASGKHTGAARNLGFMRVVRSILSYEYLWNTIRVKNGAYGAGFIPSRDGTVTFYSYRDPSPAASLEIYKNSTAYLRELAKSDCDLTKFIIGAIGEYDIITTPKTKAIIATRDCLCGISPDFEEEVRAQMLGMTKDDLIKASDILDEILSSAITVTVGGAEHLSTFSPAPKTVIEGLGG